MNVILSNCNNLSRYGLYPKGIVTNNLPLSVSSDIPKSKVLKLRKGIIKVLSGSIKLGGTTIRDYTYDYAYAGNYALNLNVFGKENTACGRCNAIIEKHKISQRGTHICPKCQVIN